MQKILLFFIHWPKDLSSTSDVSQESVSGRNAAATTTANNDTHEFKLPKEYQTDKRRVHSEII